MMLGGVFTRRYRGFRVIDLAALGLMLTLALGSYAFKTFAGAESADTAGVQGQIVQEQKRIRLLQAEIAHLEDPQRIEQLSTRYLSLKPVDPKQEIAVADLPRIAALRAGPLIPTTTPAPDASSPMATEEDAPQQDDVPPPPASPKTLATKTHP